MKHVLIVYYSWSNGNTEKIARQLQETISADMIRIETIKPYIGSYEDIVEQGKKEVNCGFEPPLQPLSVNLQLYNVIAVGTPTWWYSMAPAMASFLNDQDWHGKTVIPFMTHGGWPGHVIKDIKENCKGAEFLGEMEIKFDSNGGDHMETAPYEIANWIMQVKQYILS